MISNEIFFILDLKGSNSYLWKSWQSLLFYQSNLLSKITQINLYNINRRIVFKYIKSELIEIRYLQ